MVEQKRRRGHKAVWPWSTVRCCDNPFGRTVRLCALPATALSQRRRIRLQL